MESKLNTNTSTSITHNKNDDIRSSYIGNELKDRVQFTKVLSNHMLELLCRDPLSNLETFYDDVFNESVKNRLSNNTDTNVSDSVEFDSVSNDDGDDRINIHDTNAVELKSIESYTSILKRKLNRKTGYNKTLDLSTVVSRVSGVIKNKEFENQRSLLRFLRFKESDKHVIISTTDVSDTFRYLDITLDKALHQSKMMIFNRETYSPIAHVSKPIRDQILQSSQFSKNENSYIKKYVYDVVKGFNSCEYDRSVVSFHKNHIGTYMILFYDIDRWYFVFSNKVYEFTPENHGILYEHIGQYIHKFVKSLCYHIVLVDSRLRRLFTSVSETNYVVLIKVTCKTSLEERDMAILGNKKHSEYDKIHDVLVPDKRYYLSCADELLLRLEELDVKNTKTRKLFMRGLIMKVKTETNDDILVEYDTMTYSKLLSLVPAGMNIHEIHLKLYQDDKLNNFLQYVTDSHTDIVKRINVSMSTMSREILDIYHMTRKMKNSELYGLLPQSYRQILYQLHSDYIAQKNGSNDSQIDDSFITTNNSKYVNSVNRQMTSTVIDDDIGIPSSQSSSSSTSRSSSISIDKDYNEDGEDMYKQYSKTFSRELILDTESDDAENKVSITVDNVYTKLKELETSLLVELYRDRDVLIANIDKFIISEKKNVKKNDNEYILFNQANEFKNPVKHCTSTKIQSKLLGSR